MKHITTCTFFYCKEILAPSFPQNEGLPFVVCGHPPCREAIISIRNLRMGHTAMRISDFTCKAYWTRNNCELASAAQTKSESEAGRERGDKTSYALSFPLSPVTQFAQQSLD